MSDSQDSQFLEPSDNNSNETQRDRKINRIVEAYLDKEITDNNFSPSNGLSSLQQLIWYVFLDEINREGNFEEIVQQVFKQAKEQLWGNMDIEVVPDDQEDCYELVVESEMINKKIARAVFLKMITSDNRSEFTGYTALQEIIRYEYGDIEDDVMESLIKDVVSKLGGFKGGSNLVEYDDLNNTLIQGGFC